MFSKNVILLIITICCILINKSNSCDVFKNAPISYTNNFGKESEEQNISGCLTEHTFGAAHPVVIEIDGYYGPKFSTLQKNAFVNLQRLQRLTINYNGLQTIESESFRNLPKLTIVHITDQNLTGFSSLVFDSQLRQQIQKLNLTANKLSNMDGFAQMRELVVLDLHENELEEIKGDWFLQCFNLQSIYLNTNRLKAITAKNFVHVTSLRELYLDDNQIASIAANSFKTLEQLKILSLRRNELENIEADIFGDSQVVLQRLLLSGNLLNYLDSGLMNKIKVNELLIDGNPLNCACRDKIKTWLKNINGTLLSCGGPAVPACVYSTETVQTCTEAVDTTVTKRYLPDASKVLKDSDYLCVNQDVFVV